MGRKLAIRSLYSRHGLSDECYSCPLAERHQTKIHLEMFQIFQGLSSVLNIQPLFTEI